MTLYLYRVTAHLCPRAAWVDVKPWLLSRRAEAFFYAALDHAYRHGLQQWQDPIQCHDLPGSLPCFRLVTPKGDVFLLSPQPIPMLVPLEVIPM